jgi:autotransporter adhesin/prefoldin subunit 5
MKTSNKLKFIMIASIVLLGINRVPVFAQYQSNFQFNIGDAASGGVFNVTNRTFNSSSGFPAYNFDIGFSNKSINNGISTSIVGSVIDVENSYAVSVFGQSDTILGSGYATIAGGMNTVNAPLGSGINVSSIFGYYNIFNVTGNFKILNMVTVGNNNTINDSAPNNKQDGNSLVFGNYNILNNPNYVSVLGLSNTVAQTATSSFILGNYINATTPNNVILGNRSADGTTNPVSSITIGSNAAVAVAGSAPVGVVSVGAAGTERQIINVAAGRITSNSTDAVNGSELYITNAALADLTSKTADALLWNVGLNAFDASHGGGEPQKITNLAAGALTPTSLDAVNGGQLYTTNATVDTLNNTVGGLSTTVNTLNGTVNTLSTTVDTLNGNVGALTTTVNSLSTTVADHTNTLNTLNGTVTNLDASVTSLNNSVGALNTTVDALSGTVADNTNTLSALLGTVTNLDTTLTVLGGTVATLNETVTTLGGTIAVMSATLGEFNTTLVALGGTVTSVSGSLTALSGTVSSLNTSLSALGGTVGTINNTVTMLGGTMASISGSLGTLSTTVNTINTTIATVSGTVGQLASGSAGIWRYDGVTGGISIGAGFSGTVVSIASGTGSRRLTGVAPGVIAGGSLDAIDGAQLQSIINLIGTGTYNPSNGLIEGGTFVTGGTTIAGSITNLYNNVTNLNTLVGGGTNSYISSTNIYNSATTIGDTVTNLITGSAGIFRHNADTGDITIAGAFTGTLVDFSDYSTGTPIARKLTGVAPGVVSATSLDAINGGQLYTLGMSITNIIGSGTVAGDGSITNVTFVNGGTTISSAITNLYNSSTSIQNIVNNIVSGSTGLVQQNPGNGTITIGAATSGTVLNVAGTDGNRQITGVAAGAADNDAVNVGQLKAAGIITGTAGTIANVVSYDTAAKTTITLGGPAVSGTGANQTGGTRITNLARGALTVASADAVTGSQLYETNQRVGALEDLVSITPAINGRGASAGGADALGVGLGARADGARAMAVGTAARALANDSVALGNSAVVLAEAIGSVAIGANSIAGEPNTVSFGSPGKERRLTNVADGINPTDAVNMRQLAAMQSSVDDRLNRMDSKVQDLGGRIEQVAAMSAAMNQVQPRLSPDGNRSQLAIGVGGYRGHGAFALGYGMINRLGDHGAQISFTVSDKGEVMGGAGVVWGW